MQGVFDLASKALNVWRSFFCAGSCKVRVVAIFQKNSLNRAIFWVSFHSLKIIGLQTETLCSDQIKTWYTTPPGKTYQANLK